MTTTSSTRTATRRRLGAAVALVATMTAAACGGGSDPLAEEPAPGASGSAAGGTVTVGSADFSESKLLAHVYTTALKAQGIQVAQPRLGIGAREAYIKGMTDGSINVIPEYTGALASYYDQEYAGTDPNEVYEHLKSVLPAELTVLRPSAAENKDSITVTRQTAEQQSLRTVSDLATKAGELTLGAPPEFKARRQGIPGLKSVYAVEFGQVRELGGQALIQALVNGQVDAANVFTTDPAYVQHELVALEDDKGLFGSQNVVPLVSKEVAQNSAVTETLDRVSDALTTQDLQEMLTKVDVERQDPAAVAQEFVTAKQLG
ncbi:ABC transporter substrate-binding protein [Mobilicoccus caccae]|uniref:Amino acid ABC transporter, substrate binding protein n=1 Tax=Mobilicoccus caccae TaxID=1859295 RepID=A0ABQ6IT98_9MICO|nr:ABC transporter substrate-binding protein [Mobilicoccus caccae]GMA41169.1 putative amino acid ABC transporter, substrate binding protein [Mobilicoccus caccae]